MSQPPQPPQPPSNPPDQPYGYPQQPPYGYPEQNPYAQPAQPPQQPYGYPQQPGQQPYGYPEQNPYAQPAQPPQQPYGYPQQQPYDPAGYGQQPPAGPPAQQPGAQPPFADQPAHPPQPPGTPYQPAPDGGPRMSGGKLGAMIAGIVALVVVIGGGIWMLTSGGSSHDQATGGGGGGGGRHTVTTGRLRWTVDAPKVSTSQIVSPTPGMWFSGDDVVKQSTTDVAGYELSGGKRDWAVKVPSGHICDASSTASDGKVAVQYGTHCQDVMGIDLAHGTSLWHQALKSPGGESFSFTDADMAVSADTVAITWSQNTAAFDLTTGKPRWHAASSGGDCHDQGFAGGSRMVEVYQCGYMENAPYHVRVIDPATGKSKWTWDAPSDTKVTNVISVDPVVVGIGAGDSLITDVWDIDGGRLHGKISLGRGGDDLGKYAISCPPVQMTPCRDVVVTDDTLYMPTRTHTGSGSGQTNEIAAFDLDSGNPKWLSKDSTAPLDLVTTAGKSLVCYEESGYDSPGRIVHVAMSGGGLSTYTDFSSDTQQREHTAYGPGASGLAEGWYHDTLVFSLAEVDTSGEYKVLMAALR